MSKAINQYVVSDVFNGEGYSDPLMFIVTEDEKPGVIKAFITTYKNDENFKCIDENNPNSILLSTNTDQGIIHTFPLEDNMFTLMMLHTDDCQCEIAGVYSTKERAVEKMEAHINGDSTWGFNFDNDDIANYSKGELSFGSHDKEQGFVYFKIVTTKKV